MTSDTYAWNGMPLNFSATTSESWNEVGLLLAAPAVVNDAALWDTKEKPEILLNY